MRIGDAIAVTVRVLKIGQSIAVDIAGALIRVADPVPVIVAVAGPNPVDGKCASSREVRIHSQTRNHFAVPFRGGGHIETQGLVEPARAWHRQGQFPTVVEVIGPIVRPIERQAAGLRRVDSHMDPPNHPGPEVQTSTGKLRVRAGDLGLQKSIGKASDR